MRKVRAWPLGPNGFSYERTGRDDIVVMYDGKEMRATRKATALFIRAVRKGIRIAHAQHEQDVFGGTA